MQNTNYKNAKATVYKLSSYLLQIFLTALASAGIAILQDYLLTHGIHAGPTITPETTAKIGGVLATGKVAYTHLKTLC